MTERDREALYRVFERSLSLNNKEIFTVGFAVLEELSAKGEVRRLERLRGRWLSDYVSDISYAEKKGIQKGHREGREEGRGAREKEVILNMLLWSSCG